MSDEEKENKKLRDRLADLLETAPEKADQQEEIANAIQESAQRMREIAVPYRQIVLATPNIPREELVHQVSVLSSWHQTADNLIKLKSQVVGPFVAATSAVTNASTSYLSLSLVSAAVEEPTIEAAKIQLTKMLERAPLVEKAEMEMRRLGLDQRAGKNRIPLELLRDAHKAFGGGPGSILHPLRDSINETLAVLLRRRPTQEPAGKPNEKVESIGRQCGRPGLPAAHFPDLGVSAKRVLEALSGIKQADPPREKIGDLFYQGVSFLNTLLESVDETKLKPRDPMRDS